jgi:hypothetical protein
VVSDGCRSETDRSAGLADAVVSSQIHAAPLPPRGRHCPVKALAVHVDRNSIVGEGVGEDRACEPASLIGIEDVRLVVTSQSILQCLRNRIAPARSSCHGPSWFAGKRALRQAETLLIRPVQIPGTGSNHSRKK